MVHAVGTATSRRVPNWAVAGLLAVFVGGSYFTIIKRVSSDDLEKELEREILEEYRRQSKQEGVAGQES